MLVRICVGWKWHKTLSQHNGFSITFHIAPKPACICKMQFTIHVSVFVNKTSAINCNQSRLQLSPRDILLYLLVTRRGRVQISKWSEVQVYKSVGVIFVMLFLSYNYNYKLGRWVFKSFRKFCNSYTRVIYCFMSSKN